MKKSAELHLTQHQERQERTQDVRRHRRAMNAYFKLPKYLSSPELSERIWQQRTNILPSTPHEYIVSSSILSEMAIVSSDHADSERHAMLDMATWDLDEALAASYDRLEQTDTVYARKFLRPPNMIRLESHRAALPLFRAMVEGDISRDVRQTYAESILALSVQASQGFEYFQQKTTRRTTSRATEYIGLAHELNAIYSIARKKTPTLAAFSAFPRGDCGEFLPTQTHDIHVVGMRWGVIEDSIIAEVKTRPKPEHYERYEAVLIGGTVHLHPADSPDPSYLTELYAKEHRAIATPDELETVESISNTVMHSVRHGFTSSTQCHNPKTCTLVS